jgi:hypothetical protein
MATLFGRKQSLCYYYQMDRTKISKKFGLNAQVQLVLMMIFFFLLPDAALYLSLIFDSLLDLGGFRGKST